MAAPEGAAMGGRARPYALRKDRTEVTVEIGLTPVATEEDVVLASIVDITARKKRRRAAHLEEELRQAQKLRPWHVGRRDRNDFTILSAAPGTRS